MQTLGQQRAEFALERITISLANKNKDFKKEFKSFSAGVPSMILMNGFGQALAFMVAKNDEKHRIVFSILKKWLIQKGFVNSASNTRDFLLNIAQMDQKEYLAAQKETLALLEWVKRYAAMEAVEAGV